MPPHATWFAGRADVLGFLADRVFPVGYRAVPTGANGQPAIEMWGPDGSWHGLQVLTVRGGRVAGITAFLDASAPRPGSVRA
jgi:RNA polymerase sigma-70 factor, ECF subfamily